MTADEPAAAAVVDPEGLDALISALWRRGYAVVGPKVERAAIVLGPIGSVDDLPRGWHDEQAPGSYRLSQSGDDELFGWAVGPQSPKPFLLPPEELLWRAQPLSGDIAVEPPAQPSGRLALVGVRPCELAGLAVLDRVLAGGAVQDRRYASRRHDLLLVAAECGAPSDTCFCTSMATGPAAGGGFDLALCELAPGRSPSSPGGHRFVVRVGSEAGASVLDAVAHRDAGPEDLAGREAVLAGARRRIVRTLDTDGLPALLARNLEHPRWDEVADRCLACGNCTMVCPTCFCTDVDDLSELDGTALRRRRWSSCFELEHSFLHGGPVRASTSSRYRQWATHKLSTWHDQFGTSGCVGCGRCITWCPVGIDLTEEVAAIRASDGARAASGASGASGGSHA